MFSTSLIYMFRDTHLPTNHITTTWLTLWDTRPYMKGCPRLLVHNLESLQPKISPVLTWRRQWSQKSGTVRLVSCSCCMADRDCRTAKRDCQRFPQLESEKTSSDRITFPFPSELMNRPRHPKILGKIRSCYHPFVNTLSLVGV